MNTRTKIGSKVGGDQEARRMPLGSRIIDPRSRTIWTKTEQEEWSDRAGNRIGPDEAMHLHRFTQS